MLTIDSSADMARALASPIADDLRRLLALRRGQVAGELAEVARFVVIQPGDTIADVEATLGFSPTTDLDGVSAHDPGFLPWHEWSERHLGWTELVFVLSDEGPAQVLLVPDSEDIDPILLALCHDHA
jgi:hypothetical protein